MASWREDKNGGDWRERGGQVSNDNKGEKRKPSKLTPSTTHSVPAYSAPTIPNPLPCRHIPLPMSLKMIFAFCDVFIPSYCARWKGSSIVKEEPMREKKAPIPKPEWAGERGRGRRRGRGKGKKGQRNPLSGIGSARLVRLPTVSAAPRAVLIARSSRRFPLLLLSPPALPPSPSTSHKRDRETERTHRSTDRRFGNGTLHALLNHPDLLHLANDLSPFVVVLGAGDALVVWGWWFVARDYEGG